MSTLNTINEPSEDLNDDEASSNSESSFADSGNKVESSLDDKKAVTTTEAKQVRQIKCIILLVVFMSVCGALAVFFYSKSQEQTQFETTFYSDGNKVLQSLESSIERTLVALDNLAMTTITAARISNQTFPFVYVPDFGKHVAKVAPITGGTCTYFCPLVKLNERKEWEQFASGNNTAFLPAYIEETIQYQDEYPFYYGPKPQNYSWEFHDTIYRDDFDNPPFSDVVNFKKNSRPDMLDMYLPDFLRFPLVMTSYYPSNWDWYSRLNPEGMTRMVKNKKAVISEPFMIPRPGDADAMAEAELWCDYFQDFIAPGEDCMEPLGVFYYPIIANNSINDIDDFNGVKGMISHEFYWRNQIKNILPPDSKGIVIVFSNECVEDSFTYQIDGPKATYLGVGDFHNSKYDDTTLTSTMSELQNDAIDSRFIGGVVDSEACEYTFSVYPSEEMESANQTNQGIIFACSAVAFIVFPFMVFVIYERRVSQQQKVLISSAERSNAIVASLFPSNVRDKLYPTTDTKDKHNFDSGAPIAELHAETTVMFADISNFTVWSSVRDPYAVFTLLETIYSTFDEIAIRRNVFKVETIGDCYVAVTGLPKPRRNHAVVMVKFAQEIIYCMRETTSGLERQLGPGTTDLAIRVGLNSGPTTAGVLRGSKGRFQLFGDTVNTAARMESNSTPGKILCTQKTADLLVAAGKEHWVTERTGLVNAKGKGQMQCYWCTPKASDQASVGSGSSGEQLSMRLDADIRPTKSRDSIIRGEERLVSWVTKVFEDALKKIVDRGHDPQNLIQEQPMGFASPRSEVSETIMLLDPGLSQSSVTGGNPKVTEAVKTQLQQYIHSIAVSYKSNEFHNFEHACHVIMATNKILSRVIKPTESSASATSYGLTSDPLTHFGILFSALIHDVDHQGVSNAQLIKETNELAVKYNNQSVAEQNSVTLAWELLMQPNFEDLREAIAGSQYDLARLRQIVVNSVIATDLFDPELRSFRENRWKKAFEQSPEIVANDSMDIQSSLRAAIVIEHIIQASDVSHTMQHWHVYQKWNQRLFHEMYTAYSTGRAEKDPSIGWYEGEIWFFDNYIIPLAKKLKTCGVFGVSCDELLDYANDNRFEWEAKGRDNVALYLADMREGDGLAIDQNTNRCRVANALDNVSATVEGKVANESPTLNYASNESLSSL